MAGKPRAPEYRLSPADVQKLLRGRNGPVWRDIQLRTNRVLNKARTLAPVDTGRLRQSLTSEMRSESYGPTGRVGTTIRYAVWIHEGTGLYGPNPRYIVPVKARILRWPRTNNAYKATGGNRRYRAGATEKWVYARKVKGHKPRPFLRDALSAAQGKNRAT
jgi:hypothetical protein